MRLKTVLPLFAAVMLLAACETGPSESGGTAGTGGTASTTAGTSFQQVASRVGDRIFFNLDKSDLQPAARATIEAWADWLKANPASAMTLEGHCDERGTREYNLALGDRRASAIKNYLVALGVQGNRLRTISYGKERPENADHNEAGWAQNRRGVALVK